MMQKDLSSNDVERLSAYLDGQLDTGDVERLQARLQAEPELALSLKELRRTVSLLRSLPQVAAPRNFTLSPEMAGVRAARRIRYFPVLQFSTAIAALAFVLVTGIDLLTPWAGPASMSAAQFNAQEIALTEVLEVEGEAMRMQAADEPAPQATDLMPGQASAETVEEEQDEMPMMEAYPEDMTAEADLTEEAMAYGAGEAELSQSMTEAAERSLLEVPAPEGTAPLPGDGDLLAAEALDEAEAQPERFKPLQAAADFVQSSRLRILEALLGLAALLLGWITWRVRDAGS